jgi:hypothetical protein
MALPGRRQTFAIENAEEMTEKLWWEIEAFREEQTLEHKLWRAFNCAVTACHVTDWLWKERAEQGREVGRLGQFQSAIEDRCRELRLCRHICNASKHAGVDRDYDPSIEVIVRANDLPVAPDEVEQSRHWEIVISDHGSERNALMVFYGAYGFWVREVRA